MILLDNLLFRVIKPDVTVVVPNYNYSHFIEECLDSVLSSTLQKLKYEIIVVDDKSTDNSLTVISRYRKKHKNIKLIKNTRNLGLSKTRNIAINKSRGKYIFMLDSDNYIAKDCLEKHLDIFKHNPEVSICYAPVQRFDDKTGDPLGTISDNPFNASQLEKGNYIDVMAMVRRELFDDIGLFDEKMIYGWEDYELWLRASNNSNIFFHLDCEPLSYYRCHNNNMTTSTVLDNLTTIKRYINKKHNLKL